ncbi:MAG: DUF4982 domain-containing protein [Clostridia bacterium]|nr:DUF4982 domain-containing protein [Clostridia bacterium]
MKKTRFNQGWDFVLNGAYKGKVDLPHDFSIDQPRSADAPSGPDGGYFPGGYGEYNKILTAAPAKRTSLLFDGSFGVTEVYVNDNLVTINRYGYNGFEADLSEYLVDGAENRLNVRVNNKWQPNARWYTGSGLYRDVYLCESTSSYIDPYGLFFWTNEVVEDTARMSAEVVYHAAKKGAGELRYEIFKDGTDTPVHTFTRYIWAEAGKNRYATRFELDKPEIWDLDTPNLYSAKVTLTLHGETDTDETAFGVRTVYADRRRGFILNGRELKIRGACVHHDHGPIGACVYPEAEFRRVAKLKAVGFNTIRCTHNPQSSLFYEACDRLGMLVIDELYDYWNDGKRPDDFHLFFGDHYLEYLDTIVRRDRPHPSIVMWSTGNEIPEKGGLSDGYGIASRLAEGIRALDTSRPVTHALCGFWDKPAWAKQETATNHYGADRLDFWSDKTKVTADTLDIAGCNYMEDRVENDLIRFPDRLILITESFAIRSYDTVKRVDRTPRMLGDCVWTAWDYFGETSIGHVRYDGQEPHGLLTYPNHIADCGDIDICGFRKPQSFYREIAFGKRTDPYITVRSPERYDQPYKISGWGFYDGIPSWTWEKEGAPIEVYVFAEADEVVLECNGKEAGRMARTENAVYLFKTEYHAGTLTAKSYVEGKLTGQWSLVTTAEPAKLALTAEPNYAPAAEERLIYVDVDVLDRNGALCDRAEKLVTFTCQGAEILAVGTGKVDNEEMYVGNTRTTYLGHALVVLQAKGTGAITLRAEAEGLEAAELKL